MQELLFHFLSSMYRLRVPLLFKACECQVAQVTRLDQVHASLAFAGLPDYALQLANVCLPPGVPSSLPPFPVCMALEPCVHLHYQPTRACPQASYCLQHPSTLQPWCGNWMNTTRLAAHLRTSPAITASVPNMRIINCDEGHTAGIVGLLNTCSGLMVLNMRTYSMSIRHRLRTKASFLSKVAVQQSAWAPASEMFWRGSAEG